MRKLFVLADDDSDDVEIFRDAMLMVDPTIDLLHFLNGQLAFDYLSNSPTQLPDVIFLDINMPELNGWQTLSKIKNHASLMHIPVIMYTTSNNKREKTIAIDLGASAFIPKPTEISRLISLMEKFSAGDYSD